MGYQGRARCKECGREILWVKSKETGAPLPLDVSAPTYVITQDLLKETVAMPAEAMVSHFSTCSRRGQERFSSSNPLRDLKAGR